MKRTMNISYLAKTAALTAAIIQSTMAMEVDGAQNYARHGIYNQLAPVEASIRDLNTFIHSSYESFRNIHKIDPISQGQAKRVDHLHTTLPKVQIRSTLNGISIVELNALTIRSDGSISKKLNTEGFVQEQYKALKKANSIRADLLHRLRYKVMGFKVVSASPNFGKFIALRIKPVFNEQTSTQERTQILNDLGEGLHISLFKWTNSADANANKQLLASLMNYELKKRDIMVTFGDIHFGSNHKTIGSVKRNA